MPITLSSSLTFMVGKSTVEGIDWCGTLNNSARNLRPYLGSVSMKTLGSLQILKRSIRGNSNRIDMRSLDDDRPNYFGDRTVFGDDIYSTDKSPGRSRSGINIQGIWGGFWDRVEQKDSWFLRHRSEEHSHTSLGYGWGVSRRTGGWVLVTVKGFREETAIPDKPLIYSEKAVAFLVEEMTIEQIVRVGGFDPVKIWQALNLFVKQVNEKRLESSRESEVHVAEILMEESVFNVIQANQHFTVVGA